VIDEAANQLLCLVNDEAALINLTGNSFNLLALRSYCRRRLYLFAEFSFYKLPFSYTLNLISIRFRQTLTSSSDGISPDQILYI